MGRYCFIHNDPLPPIIYYYCSLAPTLSIIHSQFSINPGFGIVHYSLLSGSGIIHCQLSIIHSIQTLNILQQFRRLYHIVYGTRYQDNRFRALFHLKFTGICRYILQQFHKCKTII
jgi:hypothetical protein